MNAEVLDVHLSEKVLFWFNKQSLQIIAEPWHFLMLYKIVQKKYYTDLLCQQVKFADKHTLYNGKVLWS